MNISNSPLIKCLIDLGLSEREARVYLALLTRRCASATDLYKISGVPQSKIYEIISNLLQQGYFIERKVGRKRTFEIIDPKITLASLFDNLEKRLYESLEQKNELETLYENSEKASEPIEFIEVLHGNESIHSRYCQLVRNTKRELLGFGRGPYACDSEIKKQQQIKDCEGILRRGGIVRWIYELHLPQDSWILPDLKPREKRGERIRIAKSLPMKMMIFDREVLLLADEEPSSTSGDLAMSIIKQNTIVNAFHSLFEFFWEQAVEFDQTTL